MKQERILKIVLKSSPSAKLNTRTRILVPRKAQSFNEQFFAEVEFLFIIYLFFLFIYLYRGNHQFKYAGKNYKNILILYATRIN